MQQRPILADTSLFLRSNFSLTERHVKRPVRHTENEFGPYKSPGASLLRYVGPARRQPRRKRPMGPQKSTSAASQGARAAQEATDAAPGTLTRRRQPALARDCSSPRGGASSTPRRPERDRGRASPGHASAAPHRWRAPGTTATSTARTVARSHRLRVLVGRPRARPGTRKNPQALDSKHKVISSIYPEPR